MDLQFVSIVRDVLGWFVELLCKASGIPWTGRCDMWWMVSKLLNEKVQKISIVLENHLDGFIRLGRNIPFGRAGRQQDQPK